MIIRELTLYTNHLQEQTQFYQKILGLTIVDKKENSFDIKIGHTTLRFCYKTKATPYHFAFNIPSNKDDEALNWLKKRTDVLKDGDAELIDFNTWNAKAMYFYDVDKNIVELISRKNLNVNRNELFGQNQFIGVSEIGVSVQNIATTFNEIKAIKDLSVYDGNFERFCAAGDENGLFIIIDRNKKRWFPCNDYAYTSDFILRGEYNLEFKEGKII